MSQQPGVLRWPSTPLGALWAELNPAGQLTALHWGEAPQPIEETAPCTTGLAGHLATWLPSYFEGKAAPLPPEALAPRGTPFQQKVWRALLTIPYGKTVTYGALALRLATHARAIGGAVGANPIPILIPCHRVMGQGGKLTGFSAPGGLQTKTWLLKHEGIVT